MKVEYVEVDRLKPFERNPKKHPSEQIKRLIKSIEEFGWTNPILAIRHEGENLVVAGHARLEAALKTNLRKVPVIFLDLPYEKAIAYNIADNKLTELAEWDEGVLADLLNELKDYEIDFEALGFGDADLEVLTGVDDLEVVEDLGGTSTRLGNKVSKSLFGIGKYAAFVDTDLAYNVLEKIWEKWGRDVDVAFTKFLEWAEEML